MRKFTLIGGRRILKSLGDFGIKADFISSQDFFEMGRLNIKCDTLIFGASPTLRKYKVGWLPELGKFENFTCNKLIFLSSAAVYGLSSKVTPFSESNIPAPITQYGFEKLEYEKQLAKVSKLKKWNFLNLRISGIFNDINTCHNSTSLINKIRAIKLSKKNISIEHLGTQYRDFCRLSALFRFIELQSCEPSLFNGTINFRTSNPIDLKSIISELDAETQSYITFKNSGLKHINCSLNNTKLREIYTEYVDEDARTYFA